MCDICDAIESNCECNCSDGQFDPCLPEKAKNQRLQIKLDILKENYDCLREKFEKLKKECNKDDNEDKNKDENKDKNPCQGKEDEINKLKEKIISLEKEITSLKKTTKTSEEVETVETKTTKKKTKIDEEFENDKLVKAIKTRYHDNGEVKEIETTTYKDGNPSVETQNFDEKGKLIPK